MWQGRQFGKPLRDIALRKIWRAAIQGNAGAHPIGGDRIITASTERTMKGKVNSTWPARIKLQCVRKPPRLP